MEEKKKGKWKAIVVLIAVVVVLVTILALYFNSQSFQRSFKSLQSNYGGGLNREVIVYDAAGNQIYYQKGKFDVEFSDDRILYDDEDGLRHAIYFKNGTVIVNEVGKE